jgi:hypothetical protein
VGVAEQADLNREMLAFVIERIERCVAWRIADDAAPSLRE